MTAVPVPLRPARWAVPRLGRRRTLTAVGLAAIVVLAYAVRLGLLVRGAGLIAPDGYDDGVYYAAADALVHGRLPYRDFLLLHPPGIAVALAPFALLGRLVGDPVGLAAARLVFVGIGAANAGLVALLASRWGRLAGAVAGIVAACFYPDADAERSTLLEPLAALCLLAALLVARRGGARAALVAGAVAGCSADVKIWYAVPVLVLVVLQREHRLRFAAGAAGGAALICGPFLLAAPARMVQEVLLDQLGRPSSAAATLPTRLVALAGSPLVRVAGATVPGARVQIALAVLAVTLAAAVAAGWTRGARRYPVLLVATVLVVLASPSFYLHYVGYVAPWFAITLGIGLSRLLRLVPARPLRLAAAGVLLAAFVAANVPSDGVAAAEPFPSAALGAAAQRVGGCVLSDDPTVLAAMDVLSRDLAAGCPLWPDVTGWTYDRDAGEDPGGPLAEDARWQRDVLRYLTSGSAVLLVRPATGLSAASSAAIASEPVLLRRGAWVLHGIDARP